LHRDDVVVTPHVAGNTVESLRKLGAGAAENVRAVYEGRLPEATVNADRVGSLGNGDR
jgi:D-3-phosphoglycerate dehydrogenase/(S)-sulfolactate dehydrogenase